MLDRVTLLSDNTLVVANPPAEVAEQVPERLANGEAPQALLGQKLTVIPLETIRRVRGNQRGDDIDIAYRADGRARKANIGFADAATRDEVLAALHERLGVGFSYKVQHLNAIQAGLKPLIMLLIAGFFVYAGYMGALDIANGAEYDVHGRGAMFKWAYVWLASTLGPTGVAIGGGLLLLILVTWLIKRVGSPPVLLTLARTS
jgi:hypothetical protein